MAFDPQPCDSGTGASGPDVEQVLLCDVLPDGTVAGTALAVYEYDSDGNPVGPPTFVDPATGDPYVPQGTLQPCGGTPGTAEVYATCADVPRTAIPFGPNLIDNGDFAASEGVGNTSTEGPGFTTDYNFLTDPCTNIFDGCAGVGYMAYFDQNAGQVTGGFPVAAGIPALSTKSLAVNVGPDTNVPLLCWSVPLVTGTEYELGADVAIIVEPYALKLTIDDVDILALTAPDTVGVWQRRNDRFVWTGSTGLHTLCLKSNSGEASGNDHALDNFTLREVSSAQDGVTSDCDYDSRVRACIEQIVQTTGCNDDRRDTILASIAASSGASGNDVEVDAVCVDGETWARVRLFETGAGSVINTVYYGPDGAVQPEPATYAQGACAPCGTPNVLVLCDNVLADETPFVPVDTAIDLTYTDIGNTPGVINSGDWDVFHGGTTHFNATAVPGNGTQVLTGIRAQLGAGPLDPCYADGTVALSFTVDWAKDAPNCGSSMIFQILNAGVSVPGQVTGGLPANNAPAGSGTATLTGTVTLADILAGNISVQIAAETSQFADPCQSSVNWDFNNLTDTTDLTDGVADLDNPECLATEASCTPFLRQMVTDCEGVTTVTDLALDGVTPYTVTGTAVPCEQCPCTTTTTLILCDTAPAPDWTVTEAPANTFLPVIAGQAPTIGGSATLWTGGPLNIPAEFAPQPGSAQNASIRTGEGRITLEDPCCDAGTARVRVTYTVTRVGPDDGCDQTGALTLRQGGLTIDSQGLPLNMAVGTTASVVLEATVPVAQLVAGNIGVTYQVQTYRDNATCGVRSGGFVFDNFVTTVETDQTGCSNQFLRTVVSDCATGAVLATTDTTLDGTTPYTALCEVGPCADPAPGSQADIVLCDNVGQFIRKYVQDGDGAIIAVLNYSLNGGAYTPSGAVHLCQADTTSVVLCDQADPDNPVPFIRTWPVDASTGVLGAPVDTDLTGAPYVPTGTVGTCQERPALSALHKDVLPGDPWTPADATGTVTSLTYTILTGTGTVTDSAGTVIATLPAGLSATWTNDEEGTLTPPQSVESVGGRVYCFWTES